MNAHKGLSIDECVERARSILSSQQAYLLLYDVSSSTSRPYPLVKQEMRRLNDGIMERFAPYLPRNDLRVPGTHERGFAIIRGDSGVGAVNDEEVLPRIIDYQQQEHPGLRLAWSVAKDGFDNEGFSYLGL